MDENEVGGKWMNIIFGFAAFLIVAMVMAVLLPLIIFLWKAVL